MPAQAIALIVIKTVTTKGNIMKKYPINKDFDLVKFLTFPVIAQAAPIARGILGMLVNEHHGDKYIKVSKSKIEVKGGKIDVLVFEPKNDERTLPALLYFSRRWIYLQGGALSLFACKILCKICALQGYYAGLQINSRLSLSYCV